MATKNINTDLQVNSSAQFGSTSYQGNMNGGKADLSVDCGGTSQISWVGDYFQVGGTDLNYNMKATSGLITTWSQDLTIQAGNTGTTPKLRLGTNGQTSTIVCDDGDVGIGTNSPDEKLHVGGSFKVGGYMKMVSSSAYMGMIGFNRNVSDGAIYNSSYGAYQIHNNNGKLYLQVYNSSGVIVTQHAFDNNGNVGIGTASPSEKLDVNGIASASSYFKYKGHSFNMSYGQGGSDSVLFDYTHYSDNAFLSIAADTESNTTSSSGEWVASSDHPFAGGKVLQTSGGRTFYSDYIPVTPGEELYGEIYIKHISGSGGVLYYGIERFDSEKNPIGGNTGTTYFVSSNFNATSTSWTKKSGYTTLPTTHTAYNGSNGGGVYYVRIRILFNYPSGGAVRQFGGIMLKRTGVAHDQLISGQVGIGTTSPTEKLEVTGDILINGGPAGGRSLALKRTGATNPWKLVQGHTGVDYLEILEGSNTRFLIKNGGNVGIGTSAPDFKLDVAGDIGIDGKLYHNGDHNTYIGFGSDDIKLRTGGTDVITVDSSQNVGIGTTSPSEKLDVSGSAKILGRLYVNLSGENSRFNSLDANGPYVSFRNNGTTKGYIGTGYHLWSSPNNLADNFGVRAENRLDFGIGASVKMTLDSSGNVGIGTTSPSSNYKLHVAGGIKATLNLDFNNNYGVRCLNTSNSAVDVIKLNSSNELQIGSQQSNPNPTLISGSYITIEPTNFLGIPVEAIRVIDGGNVGIGTTSPANKIDVNGVGSFVGGTVAGVTDTQSAGIYLSTTGRGLHANFSGYSRNLINHVTGGIIEIGQSTSLINQIKINAGSSGTNGIVTLLTKGAERMRIAADGNVGIGTTSPSTTLDVDGITTSDAFRTNTSNTDYNVISRNSTSGTLYVQAAQSNSTQTILTCRYGSATVNQGTEVFAVRRNSSYFINTKLGVGKNNPSTALDVDGTITHKVYTVSTLPSASPAGQRAFVSDAYYDLASSHGSTFPGGGSYTIPCYSDGSNWRAG